METDAVEVGIILPAAPVFLAPESPQRIKVVREITGVPDKQGRKR